MRKSGLTGDEAYVLAKRGKTTEDLDLLKKELDQLKDDLGNASNDLIMLRAQAGIFVNESDILGVQVDYKNKTFTRLAGAVNLTKGSDFNYAEEKNTDNYEGAGFTVAPKEGYISAMGYSTKYDWLFIASECLENSSLPVGDYTWLTQNLNGYKIARLGGAWADGSPAGGFSLSLSNGVGYRTRNIGGRLVYVPTVTV